MKNLRSTSREIERLPANAELSQVSNGIHSFHNPLSKETGRNRPAIEHVTTLVAAYRKRGINYSLFLNFVESSLIYE